MYSHRVRRHFDVLSKMRNLAASVRRHSCQRAVGGSVTGARFIAVWTQRIFFPKDTQSEFTVRGAMIEIEMKRDFFCSAIVHETAPTERIKRRLETESEAPYVDLASRARFLTRDRGLRFAIQDINGP